MLIRVAFFCLTLVLSIALSAPFAPYKCQAATHEECKKLITEVYAMLTEAHKAGCKVAPDTFTPKYIQEVYKNCRTMRHSQIPETRDHFARIRDKCVSCQIYAKQAMEQWNQGVKNNCGFKVGGDWAPSYGYHFNFCIKAGLKTASQAMYSRQAILAKCRSKTPPKPPAAPPQPPAAPPKPCKVAYDPAGKPCASTNNCSYFTINLYPEGKICVLGCPPGQVRWGRRCQSRCPDGYGLAFRKEQGRLLLYCVRRCKPGFVRRQVRKSPLTGLCMPYKKEPASAPGPIWRRGHGIVNPNKINFLIEGGAPKANWYVYKINGSVTSANVRQQHYYGRNGPLNSDWEFQMSWEEPPEVLTPGQTFELFIKAKAIPHKPGLIGFETATYYIGGGISSISGPRGDQCSKFVGMTGRGEKVYDPQPTICRFKVIPGPLDEMWMSINVKKAAVVLWKYKKVITRSGRVLWERRPLSRK